MIIKTGLENWRGNATLVKSDKTGRYYIISSVSIAGLFFDEEDIDETMVFPADENGKTLNMLQLDEKSGSTNDIHNKLVDKWSTGGSFEPVELPQPAWFPPSPLLGTSSSSSCSCCEKLYGITHKKK